MKRNEAGQCRAILLACMLTLAANSVVEAKVHVAETPELLEVEKAFQPTARLKHLKSTNAKMIEVEFKIADGYYMYRKRFQFAPEGNGLKLGKVQIPSGKIKQDATFGRVETYRKSVRMLLPFTSSDKEFRFKITSQGCADVGVCYPPLKQDFVLKAGETVAVGPLPPKGALDHRMNPAPGSIADLIKKAQ
jgi:thioredoxin:protein disulfide reductase